MDRQTLEYMNDRVKKARKIIEKIENLCTYIKHFEKARAIGIPRDSSNTAWIGDSTSHSQYDNTRLMIVIRPAMIQIIAEEIVKLEAELAEL